MSAAAPAVHASDEVAHSGRDEGRGRRAFIASIWTLAGNSGQQIVGFLIFIYLARTLSVADFGIMALAAAVIDLLTIFGRFGQVEALMQRGRTDDTEASTSFWLLAAIGVAIMVGVVAVAEPLARLFDQPAVADILYILAPVPLIGNLGQVQEAFLRSRFDYRSLAGRNFTATLLSGVASIAAAAAGYGFYALVLQKLVFTIAFTCCVMLAGRWWPQLRFVRERAAWLLKVGFDVVVANLITMLNPRIVDFFVGYFLGVVTLGYLRIAWRLFEFTVQVVIAPVSNIAISSLTQLRGDKAALKQMYLRYLQLLTLTTLPLLTGVGLLAGDLIRLAASAQWLASAPILALLCLSAAAAPIGFLFPSAMLAIGRTVSIRRQALMQTIVTTATMLVSAPFGILPVMIVHLVRVYAFAVFNAATINRAIGVTLGDMTRRLAPPLLATLAMATTVTLLHDGLAGQLPPSARVLILAAGGAATYMAALLLGDLLRLWPGYCADILAMLRAVARRRPASSEAAPSISSLLAGAPDAGGQSR